MGEKMSKIEKTDISTARNKYDAEFKSQVLDVWNSGSYSTIVECAKSYNINESTLYNWLYKDKQSPSVSNNQSSEIVSLKKELTKTKMELEILKKAAIYFANHAR